MIVGGRRYVVSAMQLRAIANFRCSHHPALWSLVNEVCAKGVAVSDKTVSIVETNATTPACSGAHLCLCGGAGQVTQRAMQPSLRQGRVVERGQRLFDLGEPFRALYAVRSGSVKVYTLSDEGEEQVLGFYLPGEILGLAAIDRGYHDCGAVALETSSICELPFGRLEQLSSDVPEIQQRLYRIYAREIARDHAQLQCLGKHSAEQRLAHFLINLSARFAARGYSADEFHLSMSRHDIGNYLGLALETVSRLLARFQNQGLLAVNRRHVRILNRAALRVLSGISDSAESPRKVH